MYRDSIKCVEIDAACVVLVMSAKVQSLVKRDFGAQRSGEVFDVMQSGKLEGELGADIHDFLVDAIRNHSDEVWSGLIRQAHDDYPVRVYEFHGVFWVWAMEFDPVGYFLDQSSAIDYAKTNWDIQ